MLIPTDSGATLDVEVHGDGEPLLLIAGMSAHRDMWGPELRELALLPYDGRVWNYSPIFCMPMPPLRGLPYITRPPAHAWIFPGKRSTIG